MGKAADLPKAFEREGVERNWIRERSLATKPYQLHLLSLIALHEAICERLHEANQRIFLVIG
jgi:hypothetical protein